MTASATTSADHSPSGHEPPETMVPALAAECAAKLREALGDGLDGTPVVVGVAEQLGRARVHVDSPVRRGLRVHGFGSTKKTSVWTRSRRAPSASAAAAQARTNPGAPATNTS